MACNLWGMATCTSEISRNLLSIALCVSPLPNLLSLQGPLTALLLTSLFACLVTCRARFPELIIAILSVFVDFAASNLPRPNLSLA